MDPATLGALSVAIAFTLGLALWRRVSVHHGSLPLPPGPPPRGLLGNLSDVPTWQPHTNGRPMQNGASNTVRTSPSLLVFLQPEC